jgi:hypothetical protein
LHVDRLHEHQEVIALDFGQAQDQTGVLGGELPRKFILFGEGWVWEGVRSNCISLVRLLMRIWVLKEGRRGTI